MVDEPIAGLKECLLFAWPEYPGVCLPDSHPGFLSPHAQLPGFLEAGSSSRALRSTVIAFQADVMIHAPVVLLASLYHHGIPSPLEKRHMAAGKVASSVPHAFLAISTSRCLVIWRGMPESVTAWRGDSWCVVSVSATFGSSSGVTP